MEQQQPTPPNQTADGQRQNKPPRGHKRRQSSTAGLTTTDLAVRLRVGEAKILGWIRRGELRAINAAAHLSARPR